MTREITITKEEQHLLMQGIRPENMDFSVFKAARKEVQDSVRRYLGGQFVWITTDNSPMRLGKGTYINKKHGDLPKRQDLRKE